MAYDIKMLRIGFVNVHMVGEPESEDWVLVDTGLHTQSERIIEEARKRFKGDPKAIVLTHGHFDHIGDIRRLAERWDVPIYAHEAELPYLTGKASYPEPDPTVGGGLMSVLSRFYPNEGVDLTGWVRELPEDGTIPYMPGWRWLHTPGHTPGHVSLFRDSDHALISGDAVITVNQESAFDVLLQREELNGPPQYFTTDWSSAKASALLLESLQPEYLFPGHGNTMSGDAMRASLRNLALRFDELAVPEQGRYVPVR